MREATRLATRAVLACCGKISPASAHAAPLAHVRIRNLSGTIILAVGDDAAELSDIAESIWRAMAPGRTVRDIVRIVAAGYAASEAVVRDDVHEFLADLHARGFVVFGARIPGGPR